MGDEDEEVSTRGMDTDKAWAGLQFLLARAGTPVDVVGGGEPITDDTWAYDTPRLLAVEDVVEAARFLDGTTFASLTEHYDPDELTSAGVHPGIWDQDWALSYLEGSYGRMVDLFHAAAADREPILIWMD